MQIIGTLVIHTTVVAVRGPNYAIMSVPATVSTIRNIDQEEAQTIIDSHHRQLPPRDRGNYWYDWQPERQEMRPHGEYVGAVAA